MIPPTSGREQEPALTAPAYEEPEQLPSVRSRERLSLRGGIVFFGLIVGGGIAAGFSFLSAILQMSAQTASPFRTSDDSVWRFWALNFPSVAPWFVIGAIIAAAAEAIVWKADETGRRIARTARQRRHDRILSDDLARNSTTSQRRAEDIVEPLVREFPPETTQ